MAPFVQLQENNPSFFLSQQNPFVINIYIAHGYMIRVHCDSFEHAFSNLNEYSLGIVRFNQKENLFDFIIDIKLFSFFYCPWPVLERDISLPVQRLLKMELERIATRLERGIQTY